MWLRSWFRTSLKSCSLCKWRKPFWQTRSTAPQRQLCCWPPMLSKQSLEISQKKATKVDTLHLRDCFHRGELDQHQSVDNSEVCPKGCIYWNCWKLQKKCNPLKLKTKKYRKNFLCWGSYVCHLTHFIESNYLHTWAHCATILNLWSFLHLIVQFCPQPDDFILCFQSSWPAQTL